MKTILINIYYLFCIPSNLFSCGSVSKPASDFGVVLSVKSFSDVVKEGDSVFCNGSAALDSSS